MAVELEDFDVLDFIGKGSFASCYKIRNKHTNEILVWKVIEYGKLPEDKKQLLVTEVSLLRDLRHPHIVSYYDRIICKESKRLYIIIEYCPGGDLATLIRTCQRSLSFVDEKFVWRVLHQLSSALHACHSWLSSSVVLHRDIKPANVFLDDKGNIKLGDFGLACKLDADQIGCVETMVGTPFYMSPEVMKGEMYNSKSDVWSLGCLVYELCALVPPFNAQNIQELSAKIRKGRFPRIPSHYSDSLQKMLSSLLVVNQEQRPSIFDVVCHPVILSNLNHNFESTTSLQHSMVNSSLHTETSRKNSPTIPADRDPHKVSKDTFRCEWMARLQTLRSREAALRCREEQLGEREHAILRREHRVSLMERMVRDKMVLAEVYLKRSRDSRQCTGTVTGPAGGIRQVRPQISEEMDESFSADAGDSSIMPTSTLLDPAQLPKPPSLSRVPPPRRVHFDDQTQSNSTAPSGRSKPLFLKVAEAIRSNKCKLNAQPKPPMQQKVLHFPGYTGPAITVNVPTGEVQNDVFSPEVIENKPTGSPSVKLTVLFDDREDLRKANNINLSELDALNLETNKTSKGACSKNSDGSLNINIPRHLGMNDFSSRRIGASVDSLLDATVNKPMSSKFEEIKALDKDPVNVAEDVLKRNLFGGSLRYRRKSIRSRSTSSNESKLYCEDSGLEIDNVKNNALLVLQKDSQRKPESFVRKNSATHNKGKENMPAKKPPLEAQVSQAESYSFPDALKGRKSHSLFLRL